MRENRPYGLEGGGVQTNGLSLPLCAFAMGWNWQGESPCQEVMVCSCSQPELRRREVGWRAPGDEQPVRNESELDSAGSRGEPA